MSIVVSDLSERLDTLTKSRSRASGTRVSPCGP